MKLGLHINDVDWAGGAARLGPTLAEIARTGEAAGFDRIGVADHFWRSHYMGSVEGPELECYADACNLHPSPDIPWQLETLRRFCDEEGRDYGAIEKTCPFVFDVGEDGGKVGELLGQLRWMAGMGIQTVIGFVPYVDRITPLEWLGREVIPAIADL